MMQMRLIACAMAVGFCPLPALSQPGTEIFLFDVKSDAGVVTLSNGRNITNREGYDNQPSFHPDKPLLYFVSADGEGRTDIFEYNYNSNAARQITDTPEKEYSPTVTPDRHHISCIIQRDDGAQVLAQYPIDGAGMPHILVDDLIVGYHAWGDAGKVVLFALPRPFALHLVDLREGADSVVARDIGRSLHRIPGTDAVSFLQQENDEWVVKSLDISTLEISRLAQSLKGSDRDMAWMKNGDIIMGDANRLFHGAPAATMTWKEVEFLSGRPVSAITRIAVSPGGEVWALVVNEE